MLRVLLFLSIFHKTICQCEFSTTSTTIINSAFNFPSNCTLLIGRFRIDGSSEVTDTQLSQLFANIQQIEGVVQIWNSDLQTAQFLGGLKRITGDAYDKTLSILNNTQLATINLTSLEFADGKVEIRQNPHLTITNCTPLHQAYFTRRTIDNLECGCELTEPFEWPFGPAFPDGCEVVYGDLVIGNPAPKLDVLYEKLERVKRIYGMVQVDSNLETLGFLQNLEDVESDSDSEFTLNIRGPYLGRLDLIHLRSVKSRNPDAKIRVGGQSTCLDPEFVRMIVKSPFQRVDLARFFCGVEYINNPSYYCTGPILNVPERCTRYIGDIRYLNSNPMFTYTLIEEFKDFTKFPAKDMRKIEQFEMIFGSLFIEGTAISNFSLPNLLEIYTMDETAISMKGNYFLKSVEFAKLEVVQGVLDFYKNVNMTISSDWCEKMENLTWRSSLSIMEQLQC